MPSNGITSGIVACCVLLAALGAAREATPQSTSYPKMGPIAQYLMERSAEIALARTAAPASISRDAAVLVLTRHGFREAVHGTNGFVCIVGRGWSSAADADFWSPKVRVPICMNAAAARSYLLRITAITNLVLAGRTLAQVNQSMAAAVAKKQLPPMATGAMCYMMSKEGYGGSVAPHWPSHLMFFYSGVAASSWGANLPGSPLLAVTDAGEQMTQFVITVQHWSDGTDYVPSRPAAGQH